MFDISIAGPLTGLLASLLALVLGSQLTLVNDPSLFPALPLELLRQSSLGGGIINAVLGNNVLGLPGGVTAAGMTVVLHPVAIAGFFGLFVNALSLLPVGSKWNLLFRVDSDIVKLTHFVAVFCLSCSNSNGRRKNCSSNPRKTSEAFGGKFLSRPLAACWISAFRIVPVLCCICAWLSNRQ